MPEEKSLPKPKTDLPLPEKDLPLPENEITAHASEPVKTTVVKEERPHKSSMVLKSFLLGILFVILIVLIGGGAFIMGKNNKDNKQVVQTQVSAPSPTPNPTADWPTFDMPLYSLQAPSEFRRDEKAGNPTSFLAITNYDVATAPGRGFDPEQDKGMLKVEIYQIETAKDLKSYVQEIEEADTYTEIAINGVPALKHTSETGLDSPILIKHPNENIIFGINFYLDFDNYQELSNQILSTFKFTEPKDVLITAPPGANPTGGAMVACTMDAKLCPDGSSVGRTGPKCEFEKCPGE